MSTGAVILNILLIILEIVGLRYSVPEKKLLAFAYYTQLSNLMAFISAVLLLIFGAGSFPVLLRYLGTCMMLMTFMVTSCVLVPMGGDPKLLLFSGTGLFVHLLCPIVCIVSYIFFETHSGVWPVPVIVTFAYGMIMLYLNHRGIVDGPYPFFRIQKQGVRKTVLWMAALTCLITAVSLIVKWIAR